MNALQHTARYLGLASFAVATALSTATPAQADDSSMIIDGIMATLTTRDGADVVMLDTRQGSNRSLREQQAVDAAKSLTGCHATVVSGTDYDTQGADAQPVLVRVELKC